MLWVNNRQTTSITPPNVTSPASVSVDEGQPLAYTITADKIIQSVRLDGGPDDARVQLQTPSIVDWTVGFLPDFEVPLDADTNNSYVIWLVVTDIDGLDSSRFTLTITINDVVESIVGAATATVTPASDSEVVAAPSATNAESYEYEINASGTWMVLPAALVISGLAPATAYNFRFRGVAGGVPGEPSSSVPATTLSTPAFYAANAVVFDGTDRLERGASLTGAADSNTLSFVCVCEPTAGAGTNRTLLHNFQNFLRARISSGNKFEIQGLNAAGTIILHLITNESVPVNSGYIHIHCDVDLANGIGEVYLNGTVATFSTSILTNDTIDLTRSNWGIAGNTNNSDLFTGRISHLAFSTTRVAFSNLVTRRKFLWTNGHVRDPGADGTNWFTTSPIILLSGATAGFETNKGTGGGFTLTGTLGSATIGPNGALGTAVTAFKSDDWVEFAGHIQTHANFPDATWSDTGWRALLGETHARYSRGGWAVTQARNHLTAIYNSYGIRAAFPFNVVNADGTFSLTEMNNNLSTIANQAGAEKFWCIEGVNEYTNGHLNERAFSVNTGSNLLTTTTSIIKVAAGAATTDATANHGLPNGQAVQLTTTGTLPAPLQPLTVYWVRDSSGATLKLAATSGGAVIDITTTGTGTHRISRWAPLCRAFQADLYNAVKSYTHTNTGIRDAMRALAVAGPTLYRRVKQHYEALGVAGGCTNTADFSGLHLYNGGRKPSVYNGDTGNDPIIQAMQDARLACAKPVNESETGYNLTNEITEDICTIYILRHIAEPMWLKVNSGGIIEIVQWYVLVDSDAHGNYGLASYSGGVYTARLPYYSYRNFMFHMKDATWSGTAWTYPSFTPGALTFDINLNGNSLVKYLVCEKQNGRFYLVLWYDELGWDRQTSTDLRIFTAAAGTEITVPAGLYAQRSTGDPCTLTTSNTLPGGLSLNTTYWIIKSTANKFKLATSLLNAQAGTAVTITSAGTGTHRLTQRATVNFSINAPTFTTMNIFEPAVLRGEVANTKRDTPLATDGTPNVAKEVYVPDHMMLVELVP